MWRNNSAMRPPKTRNSVGNMSNTQRSDKVSVEALDELINSLYSDKEFSEKYIMSSMFLVGHGAFGSVFRVVTNAKGPLENPKYPHQLVKYLQRTYRTAKATREALLDSYREEHCLDLVAVKFEHLSQVDLDTNAIGSLNLIREFYLMQELFSHPDSRYAMVGFPLPIDFGYIGDHRPTKSLNKVITYNPYGMQESYKEAYMQKYNIFGTQDEDVTLQSYLTMELVGPNLDDWKRYFSSSRGHIRFSVQTTFKLMDQVLCRLLVMHRKNMVHLDLKPDNICLGVGKMVNTVYILDFGLSRLCSNHKPEVTMGSRRYMSVGVLNFEPTNYMMDIESWFYILIVLLTDYIPWSDEELSQNLTKDEKEGGAREEKLQILVAQAKKAFWNDNGMNDKKMLHAVIKKIERYHRHEVPDIVKNMLDIYEHIKKMRQDFYRVNHTRMNADIRDEESDLFKRYKTLRKLLLFVYDCDFTSKSCCFFADKDLIRRQQERKQKHKQLVYAENGRDWLWDWDEWFAEDDL